VFARHGYLLDDDARRRARDDIFDGQEHLAHSRSRCHYLEWELERLRRLAIAAGVAAGDLEPLVTDLHAAARSFTLAAYPDSAKVLSELRRQGLTVAVCSNWNWDLVEAMDAVGLRYEVDAVVTSAQVGARKPHPLIFKHTLEECGVSAGRALFVGDTWGADVEGPLAAGMRAVHLVRPGAVAWRGPLPQPGPGEPPPLPGGAYRVTSLDGLLDLVRPGA